MTKETLTLRLYIYRNVERTNIKHIVFEFLTYILWTIYAGHVSSSVVWSAFSVCLSKAFYQLICLFGLLVLRNVALRIVYTHVCVYRYTRRYRTYN